ncbi:MAG: 5-formyltetrahydrofolate cyclo-ligase [Candidatus Omnitrophica bacterium]|nr:5-formyltetrahydrofolate cyclo-ligase [Candidatus Omnitrophota bacterium]
MEIPTKQELRKRILDLIQNQKEEDALRKSRVILDKFLALPVFKKAKTVLFYASCRGEVDTFAMMDRAIELKKRVALPRVQKENKKITAIMIASTQGLKPGAYNIPEPEFQTERVLNPKDIDLVVVPGVAFDRQGNRLGRGAGFYDRFLSELPSSTVTIGLAYDLQLVEALTGLERHDRPVTQVLTN